jgi:hypothetical protein
LFGLGAGSLPAVPGPDEEEEAVVAFGHGPAGAEDGLADGLGVDLAAGEEAEAGVLGGGAGAGGEARVAAQGLCELGDRGPGAAEVRARDVGVEVGAHEDGSPSKAAVGGEPALLEGEGLEELGELGAGSGGWCLRRGLRLCRHLQRGHGAQGAEHEICPAGDLQHWECPPEALCSPPSTRLS